MNRNVWILNHYAGEMYFSRGGRHYWIAKYLKKLGYDPLVVVSNAVHGSDGKLYGDTEDLWYARTAEEIQVPFVFVRSRPYVGNGKARILNMADFYRNTLKAADGIARKYGKPDIIYASSVHPLTLVAGIKLAKRYGVKCVSEVRDLWPESIVAYGILKRNSLLAKVLYAGEKWIYRKADKIVMTWPGGYDYIVDRGWEKVIPREKVVHISNGVDLEEYRENMALHPYAYPEDVSGDKVRLVYAGSIRKVNNLGILLEAARILQDRNVDGYELLIFGEGDDRPALERRAQELGLETVRFMGCVPKVQVPSVLAQADINILHNSSTSLDKYGQSQNKFFEYLASGKPVLMTYSVGHSVVKEKQCGVEVPEQTPEAIADAIEWLCRQPRATVETFSENARRCAEEFDFKLLTDKVVALLEELR